MRSFREKRRDVDVGNGAIRLAFGEIFTTFYFFVCVNRELWTPPKNNKIALSRNVLLSRKATSINIRFQALQNLF